MLKGIVMRWEDNKTGTQMTSFWGVVIISCHSQCHPKHPTACLQMVWGKDGGWRQTAIPVMSMDLSLRASYCVCDLEQLTEPLVILILFLLSLTSIDCFIYSR